MRFYGYNFDVDWRNIFILPTINFEKDNSQREVYFNIEIHWLSFTLSWTWIKIK